MQTALHIYHIVTVAKRELIGAEFVGSEFYRKERLACMYFKRQGKGNKRLALALRFHPTANSLVFVPAGKIEVTTSEKSFPFFQERYRSTVISIEQLGFDRIVKIVFSNTADSADSSTNSGSIIVEAMGPSGNLWWLNGAGEKTQVLRNRDFLPTDVYAPPTPASGNLKIAPEKLSAETLLAFCKERPECSLVEIIFKGVAGFETMLAREALSRAKLSVDLCADEIDTDSALQLSETIKEFPALASGGQSGYLYSSASMHSAFPFKLNSVDEQPEKFQSYSLAELALMRTRKEQGAEDDLSRRYLKALNGALKRLRRTIGKMKADLSEYENFERHKELADILKANLHELKRGMESVTLIDLYRDGEVTVALDAKFSPVDNADRYYKKYQKGRQGLSLLQRRLENSELEMLRLDEIAAALEADADSAQMRYADELTALLRLKESQQAGTTVKPPRAPYRTYTLSTGLTIYVGRDGSDNDDTTFKHIKPYELWFHASQCPGSHVGLKFPNKSFAPSKMEIEETAAIAAWFSKARKNKLAPVNYTQRKYVRKPRKAKAGLVTIEREKTVMVEPQEPSAQ